MYTYILQCNCRAIPLLSAFPLLIPFCSPFVSLYLLGTLLVVIGSCPPRSQVARKLIFPFPSPYPYTPYSKIPTPPGSPRSKYTFIRTTSRTWFTRSSTITIKNIIFSVGQLLSVNGSYNLNCRLTQNLI
jgi:hypothetical protein